MKIFKSLHIESHREQEKHWPQEDRHILAQYDDDSVIAYQAYPTGGDPVTAAIRKANQGVSPGGLS